MFEAEVQADFSDGIAKLNRVARNEKSWRLRFLKMLGEEAVDMIREAIDDQLTYGRDTGAWAADGSLRRSIASYELNAKGIKVGSRGVIYAKVHEFGATGANAIRPVRAPKLVFYIFNEKQVRDVVYIPPRPYIRPVFYGVELRQDRPEEIAAKLEGHWHKGSAGA